jgi:hydrogenase nickel incorporation protein HypB
VCDTCGCGDPDIVPVEVHERILEGNDRTARHNREHFEAKRLLAINLMGSPGAGKTAVLEATARALEGRRRLGALAGDLETDRDAQRLMRAGIPSIPITTGSACHLDAELVHRALHGLPAADLDFLFIENVGNLVCPAIYDLGQAANVVALSVTEGEDKPLKYPIMFRKADLVLLTKIDLLPHLPDVRVEAIEDALRRVMPEPLLLPLSSRTGEGMAAWVDWLENGRAALGVEGIRAARGARS